MSITTKLRIMFTLSHNIFFHLGVVRKLVGYISRAGRKGRNYFCRPFGRSVEGRDKSIDQKCLIGQYNVDDGPGRPVLGVFPMNRTREIRDKRRAPT